VNTVNFSNHSGYGRSGGSKTTAAELNATFESMEQNELLIPTRLLTGKYLFPLQFKTLRHMPDLSNILFFRVYTRCRSPLSHPQTGGKAQTQ